MKKLINKNIFAIALVPLTHIGSICAVKIPSDEATQHKRSTISQWSSSYFRKLLLKPPTENVSISRDATYMELNGRCHHYVFSQITENMNIASYEHSNLWFCAPHYVKTFFEETANPQEDDLIVYSKGNSIFTNYNDIVNDITHYSLFKNQHIAESKWGDYPKIINHGFENVPYVYGNTYTFYTLKDKTPEGKKALKQALEIHKTLPHQQCANNFVFDSYRTNVDNNKKASGFTTTILTTLAASYNTLKRKIGI